MKADISDKDSSFEFKYSSSSIDEDGKTTHKLSGRFRTTYQVRNLRESTSSEESAEERGKFYFIEGVASSTSVDHYGTEMSLEALQKMSTQMQSGIPILPRHNSFANGGLAEWDEVIGRTVNAEIRSEQVKNPKSSENFVLLVRSQLYSEDERSKELIKRLERGEPIGQSIGGWFEDVSVIENSDGQVERIIIQDVTLDHVAITRAPANPDSNGLVGLAVRSMIGEIKRNSMENEPKEVEAVEPAEEVSQEQPEEVRAENEKGEKFYSEEEYAKLKEEYAALQEEYDALKNSVEENYSAEDGVESLTEEAASEERVITSFADLPLAAEDVPWGWDTTAQDEVLGKGLDNWDRYKRAHIYMDPDKNPESKSAYKLPVARMINGELRVVLNGVVAAMAALNGARGGVDMPDEEKPKAYEHLSKYYKKFGKEPPELKLSSSSEEYSRNPSAETEIIDSRNINGESDMTENDLKALAEIVTRTVLEALPQASASTEEKKEEVEQEAVQVDENAELRSRLEKAEQMIARMASTPVRTGRHAASFAGPLAHHEFSRSIQSAKEGGSLALAAVVERSVEPLTEFDTNANYRDILSSALRAAEMDGLINSRKPSWS